VLAKDVADVLAEKTFDALAKFLDAINIELGNLPLGVGARLEGGNFFVDVVVPGDVGDQILNPRKRLHGRHNDGLILGQIVHSRLAGETRAAVHFGGTRAALPCLAVPADSEIGSKMALDVVERIEDDHAGSNGNLVIDGMTADSPFAAKYS
jgi:hypothetical protein